METFWDTFGIDSGALLGTMAALALFGILYNHGISYAQRRGWNDGYTWLEVVIGVGVVVAASAVVLGGPAAIALFLLFTAAGFPMAAGDIWRHVQARMAEIRDLKRGEGNDDAEALAE